MKLVVIISPHHNGCVDIAADVSGRVHMKYMLWVKISLIDVISVLKLTAEAFSNQVN